MQSAKTSAENSIAVDSPAEKAALSEWAIIVPKTATPITPPSCLAEAINPEAIPASCWVTDESIAFVIDGTDMALPMPTSMSAPLSSHKEECDVICDSAMNPTICTVKPVAMIRVALNRLANRDESRVERVSTAVNGINDKPVFNAS